jgi:hypothetical protein
MTRSRPESRRGPERARWRGCYPLPANAWIDWLGLRLLPSRRRGGGWRARGAPTAGGRGWRPRAHPRWYCNGASPATTSSSTVGCAYTPPAPPVMTSQELLRGALVPRPSFLTDLCMHSANPGARALRASHGAMASRVTAPHAGAAEAPRPQIGHGRRPMVRTRQRAKTAAADSTSAASSAGSTRSCIRQQTTGEGVSNAKHRLADAEDVHAFCRAARLSVQVAPALHAALKAKAAQHTQVNRFT